MQPSRPASAATAQTTPRWGWLWAPLMVAAGAVVTAQAGRAQGDDVTVSYGYSSFGTLLHGPDIPHLPYVNPDAPKGGEIAVWSQGNFDSFNQYARVGVPAALNTIGTERIMASAYDDPYGLYCLLCETVEYPADRSFVTFNLRTDVTFQDGTPMTAEDVAFTHALFLEQGIIEYRRLVERYYESVEVLGPHRIRFNFTDEAAVRDRVGLAGGLPVFSQAWFEETGARLDESTREPFMATGAYVLDEFDQNRQILYARNPDYWGYDHPLNVGRFNFDRIRVEYYADASAALEGFKSGDYTFRVESSSRDWATGYDFPNLNRGHVIKEELADGSVGQRLSLVYNLDREKWQDERVRQALGMMFNFEWSNQTLFFGLYKQPVSFWPGTELAASGTPSAGERAILEPLVEDGLLDAVILTEEAEVPVAHEADGNQPGRRILREASRLLDEAGWEIGDDGQRRKDGRTLDVVIIQFNPLFDRIMTPFVNNLTALGVNASLERIDVAQYVERRRSGDFDLTNQGFQMPFEPSGGLLQWFGSATADNSSRNLARLRNEAVDRLIATVMEADSQEALTTSVHALDRVLRSLNYDIPLWYNDQHWVAHYTMYGRPDPLPPLALGQYDMWWYDAEGHAALREAGVLR